ncbi:MAG TPA: GntR family transcriptional regulator [Streptosporangiaceae bacterium]|nr:GntR family transcriptional regulator [Streptosporangiaceae bacterium]
MTEVDPITSPEYTYIQAANAIAARIAAGGITHQLPADRVLPRELGVAYQTLRHAMKVLRDRGLIITRQGRGTFVAAVANRDDGCDGR